MPDYGRAIKIIEDYLPSIGHTHVNPESLTATRVMLDDGEFEDEDELRRLAWAYNTAMQGFREMLAPKQP